MDKINRLQSHHVFIFIGLTLSWNIVLCSVLSNYEKTCHFGNGCVFQCHCQKGDYCNPLTGECSNGCDPGPLDTPWHGPACQIGNIAYGKTVQMPGWNLSSGGAVDGVVDVDYSIQTHSAVINTTTEYLRSMYPEHYWTDAWLRIDLGGQHRVYKVLLKNPKARSYSFYINEPYNLQNTIVSLLDGNGKHARQCEMLNHTDVPVPYTTPTVPYSYRGYETLYTTPSYHRLFNTTYTGRNGSHPVVTVVTDCQAFSGLFNYVKVSKKYQPWMVISEVVVIGYKHHVCKDNYFGPGCRTPCHCGSKCDPSHGTCWTDCLPGWKGTTCQEKCNDFHWGLGCKNRCKCADIDEVCYHIDGHCASGCLIGYSGTACENLNTDYFIENTATPITTTNPTNTILEGSNSADWQYISGAAGAILLLNSIVLVILAVMLCKKQRNNDSDKKSYKPPVSRLSSNSSQVGLTSHMYPSFNGLEFNNYERPKYDDNQPTYTELNPSTSQYYDDSKSSPVGRKKLPLRRTDSSINHRYISSEQQHRMARNHPTTLHEEDLSSGSSGVYNMAVDPPPLPANDSYMYPVVQRGEQSTVIAGGNNQSVNQIDNQSYLQIIQ